tara:strand:- start:1426 stop:2007 length:582 start_codon:yes stop_codon:yes gene_type:complete
MPKQKVLNETELLDGATDLFWKNGYHKTSIQDLVNHIGINRANLYENYKDKEELFNQCLVVYQNRMRQKINKVFNESKNVKSGFKLLFNNIVEIIRSEDKKGCMISNTYSELLPNPSLKTSKILDESQKFWIDSLECFLENAIKNKEIKSKININHTAQAIYTSIVGVTILGKTNTSEESLINSLNQHLSIFK